MSPLPPAFERLATALELSAPDFSLSFVTGPRDHVDSVYLRLVRALGDTYEFVRHRVDRDGVNLRAALGGGSGERPRVVFVSGLERMSDETRADATARLNLVRDSWGPYPAQVVFWLPSWGLVEFRRLAPDLFDWRSNLTVLHDADLPVRDEEEYLVWVVERHGRAPLNVATATYSLLVQAHPRLVSVHLGTEARELLARIVTEALAALRLHTLEAARHRAASNIDLDSLLALAELPSVSSALAPVWLRSVELAANRDTEPGWDSVTRAAGIPGDETAATVLAELAERQQLIVVLDGIDQLDLRPDGFPHRLVSWLATTPAHLFATLNGACPPLLSAWTVLAGDDASTANISREATRDAGQRLRHLLANMFETANDLVLLGGHLFGPDIASELSAPGHPSTAAERFVHVCERHGLIDAAFFAELKRIRPRFAAQIDEIARAYLHK